MTEFTLRKFKKSDAESFARYADNKKIAKNLRDAFPHPYGRENAKVFIGQSIKADESAEYVRAIDVNGDAVGCVGIYRNSDVYLHSAEIGYWIGEPFWNQGIVTAAVGEMCRRAFDELGIVRISAEVFAYNNASCRVLEKNGFHLEGVLKSRVFKHGKIYDAKLYSLICERRGN